MKFILYFIVFLIQAQLHANSEIRIQNSTKNEIKFIYNYLNNNVNILIQETTLKHNEIYNATAGRYVINDNYLIELKDTYIECSWAYTLWVKHANGWGIQLFVNHNEFATICAHKYSIVDYQTHAQLNYYSDDSGGDEKLIFKNIGWWAQSGTFPIETEVLLTPYKKTFTDTELEQFLHGN